MNKVAVCHNVANNKNVILGVNQIKEMIPVNNGDPYIRVDYYDYEMCLNRSMWCDNIKFEMIEDEEVL
jgi:hypothetical protein